MNRDPIYDTSGFLYGNNNNNDFFSINYNKNKQKEKKEKMCKICKICGCFLVFSGFNALSFYLGYLLNL